ncbi:MAG TPA: hypothetical protein VEO74_11595 [Thermoanaerobaculia bacterium]|nr:hypothetical protein [Thermoanaerobaculia bacterium]
MPQRRRGNFLRHDRAQRGLLAYGTAVHEERRRSGDASTDAFE